MTDWNPNDPDATKVYYDLSAWSIDEQAELTAEMANSEIPHTWEGTELVVPEASEQAADLVIADVEARLQIESAPVSAIVESLVGDDAGEADAVALAEDVPTTEYDLDQWPAGDRDLLGRALAGAGIPFTWEGNVLLVATDDEALVDELLDDVESGEYVDADDDEPGETPPNAAALTTFFLAGERLRHDPPDADGLEQLVVANEAADPDQPPFGVQPRLWQRTCELAD
ncbi:MAG: hypothetical protein HZB15_06295, partial [Actinobacteria bacterium]|nr:hypothetical protein [Actinomycetota bacterium]